MVALKLSEVQLDNLLHVYTERGAIDAVISQTSERWNERTEKALKMYTKTKLDVSPVPLGT